MPIYPPRNEPVKKKQQLARKKFELESAIKNNVANHRLNKSAEKYRTAQLSLLKVKLHELQERHFQKKPPQTELESIEQEIDKWANQSVEEIISQFKT